MEQTLHADFNLNLERHKYHYIIYEIQRRSLSIFYLNTKIIISVAFTLGIWTISMLMKNFKFHLIIFCKFDQILTIMLYALKVFLL